MMRRLYHRIFFSLLGGVVLALLLAALAGHALLGDLSRGHLSVKLTRAAEQARLALPAPDRPDAEVEQSLSRAAAALHVELSLWAADGRLVASSAPAARMPDAAGPAKGRHTPPWLPAVTVPVDGNRLLVVWPRFAQGRPGAFLFVLALFALALGIGSYPVARRLTRRLEALEHGVQALGERRFGTRVEVDGTDEVSSLARSFNRAAESIEHLVEAQRRVLASASHELRSPLARLRMAFELLRDDPAAGSHHLDAAVADIEELDRHVDDLLLASRLESGERVLAVERVDLAALVESEATRTGAAVEVRPVTIDGDPRMIRSLARNLLENAVRHAGGAEVTAGVEPLSGEAAAARLWVADRGPGVAPEECERIFEPFYRLPGHREGDRGVGLGLSLVRQIALAHRGSATCRPRDGGGTVFEVVVRSAPCPVANRS